MDLASRAFDWIASVAVAADGGLAWREDGVLFDDLYSGTAGVLLGCAEADGGRPRHGARRGRARGRLLSLARQGPGAATMPDDGVFSGWAGVALALRAWSDATGDPAAAQAAAQVTRQIAGRVTHAPPDPPVHRRHLR